MSIATAAYSALSLLLKLLHLWPADADAWLLRVEVHAAVYAVQQVGVLIGVPDHVAVL
jgi:hypothetical protein